MIQLLILKFLVVILWLTAYLSKLTLYQSKLHALILKSLFLALPFPIPSVHQLANACTDHQNSTRLSCLLGALAKVRPEPPFATHRRYPCHSRPALGLSTVEEAWPRTTQ